MFHRVLNKPLPLASQKWNVISYLEHYWWESEKWTIAQHSKSSLMLGFCNLIISAKPLDVLFIANVKYEWSTCSKKYFIVHLLKSTRTELMKFQKLTVLKMIEVGLSPSKKVCVICFIEGPLTMHTGKNCFIKFSKRMAAWLLLWPFSYVYYIILLITFYTFYYHVLKSTDVWKMWFFK